jgi:hypothetical protein
MLAIDIHSWDDYHRFDSLSELARAKGETVARNAMTQIVASGRWVRPVLSEQGTDIELKGFTFFFTARELVCCEELRNYLGVELLSSCLLNESSTFTRENFIERLMEIDEILKSDGVYVIADKDQDKRFPAKLGMRQF